MTGAATGADDRFLIAGGGIGGLAAAIALAQQGIASQIFEKRGNDSEDGAGIQIGPNGLKVLRALGVADALEPLASKPSALVVHNGTTGRALSRNTLNPWMAERHGADYWTLHRADLHAVLVAAAKAHSLISITRGRAVRDYKQDAASIEITLADGEAVQGAALIVADGLWSTLRPTITGAAPPAAFGKRAFRTVVPAAALAHQFEANCVHLFLSHRQHAVMYPVRGGEDTALIVITDGGAHDTTWSTEVDRSTVQSAAFAFAPPLRALIESARGWRMWSLHTLAPLERWTDGRAAVLGDAAHPVLPFLAQGAVMALEDAAVLAKCAVRFCDDPAAALTAYAAIRQPRTTRVAEAARRNGRIYHLRSMSAAARDIALRAAPNGRLLMAYDWLYGADA